MKYYISILFLFWVFLSFSQSLGDNLLLHYKFDNDFTDFSGNNFDGVNFGAQFGLDRYGNENSAIYFDGIDDYIDFPNISELKPLLPVSFSFFIKYDNLSYEDSTVFNTSFEEDVNSGIYMNIQSSTGKYQISFGDGTNGYSINNRTTYTSNSVIDDTEWHHIAIVVNASNDMKIYVDCLELGGLITGFGNTLQYSALPGALGRHDRDVTGPADYFKGAIDDFMYWDRAISQSEVNVLCRTLSNQEYTIEEESIRIYPNPTSGKFRIVTKNAFESLQIFDSFGRLIKSQEYTDNVDISNYSNGIYILRFFFENQMITKKIVLNN